MSRHIPRHRRWNKLGPSEYTSGWAVVRYERGGWYAWVSYEQAHPVSDASALPQWEKHRDQLGPFKRPRNAMMAAEEHARWLQRQQTDNVHFAGQTGA
jgi:hypothetical protein